MKINLTKLEAEALYQTSDQMKDDFLDYYSFMGYKKRNKFHDAFISGREKLLKIIQSNSEPDDKRSVATEVDSKENDGKIKIKKDGK